MKFTSIIFLLSFISFLSPTPEPLSAPDFNLPSLDGKEVSLASLKGKIIVLDFWFIRCPGCKSAVPALNDIQSSYDKDKVEIIGIEYQDARRGVVADYVKRNNVQFTTLLFGKTVAARYKVFGGPTIIIIDQEGNIIYDSYGFDTLEIHEKIQSLL